MTVFYVDTGKRVGDLEVFANDSCSAIRLRYRIGTAHGCGCWRCVRAIAASQRAVQVLALAERKPVISVMLAPSLRETGCCCFRGSGINRDWTRQA
jgi:hypothetical protein